MEVRHPESLGVGTCCELKAMHVRSDFKLRFSKRPKKSRVAVLVWFLVFFISGAEQVTLRWDFSKVSNLQGFGLISLLPLSITREEICVGIAGRMFYFLFTNVTAVLTQELVSV